MDMSRLCSIKSDYTDGIDALQLYNIPNRIFDKCFYFHDMEVHDKGFKHEFSRLSINTIDFINSKQKYSASELRALEKLIRERHLQPLSAENQMFEPLVRRMQEISQSIVSKLEQNMSKMQALIENQGGSNTIQKARFIYLVELSNHNIPRECWFIGTEKFEVKSKRPVVILDNAQIEKLTKLQTE
jgi:hypothetical protein